MARFRIVLLAVLVSSSSSLTAAAQAPASPPAPSGARIRVAVLAVPGDDAQALALAAQFRGLLTNDDVVDDATLARRLLGPIGTPVDLRAQQAAAAAADEAFNALDHERSVSLLGDVIEQLENDRDFSVDKAALLQAVRLTCAKRLLGLAGPSETGNGETKNGTRARAHLANVMRANPRLVLDASRYPPKMHALLDQATADVRQAGQGGLAVRSTPPGAVVFVEGRALGTTPLDVKGAVPAGRYRLWLEKDGRRSVTRVVDIVAGASLPAEIDIGFEGSLVPQGPGLTPLVPFTPAALQRLAGFVDVDVVIAVGVVDGAVWGLSAEPRGLVRQGSVPVGQEASLSAALRGGSNAGVTEGGVPAWVFAPGVAALAGPVEPPGEFPWVAVGVGTAVGAVVVAGAIAAGVVYATREVNSTIGVSFGDPP